LLGRQDVKRLLDELKEDESALVDEVVPSLLTVGDVQRVLQRLLREGVPIRDMVTILETLGDHARHTKDHGFLTERVREGLARQITKLYTNEQGFIPVVTLDPALEEEFAEAMQGGGAGLSLPPERIERFYGELSKAIEAAAKHRSEERRGGKEGRRRGASHD